MSYSFHCDQGLGKNIEVRQERLNELEIAIEVVDKLTDDAFERFDAYKDEQEKKERDSRR